MNLQQVAVALVSASVVVGACELAGAQHGTYRVSVNSFGAQVDNGGSTPSISADGRFVAFWSYASNLVSGDTNGAIDVFVHDRQTGTTERVSVDSAGTQGKDRKSVV